MKFEGYCVITQQQCQNRLNTIIAFNPDAENDRMQCVCDIGYALNLQNFQCESRCNGPSEVWTPENWENPREAGECKQNQCAGSNGFENCQQCSTVGNNTEVTFICDGCKAGYYLEDNKCKEFETKPCKLTIN